MGTVARIIRDDGSGQFEKSLRALAVLCNYPLNDELADIYTRMLRPLGFKAAAIAISQLVTEMDLYGSNSFPSIGAIRRKITGAPSLQMRIDLEQAEASLAASSIIAACSKYGSVLESDRNKLWEVKNFVGPLAWLLIEKRGGWNAVCGSVTNRNMAAKERQFENLAKAMIIWERKRSQPALR